MVNMVSIIIPTLNEEDYLSDLLQSIKEQKYKDYEIIVSDAGSKDRTVSIAKEFGCTVVKGGSPARGRNEGAKVARGEIFMFVDSDVTFPENFLKEFLSAFKERKADVAGCALKIPSKKKIYRVYENIVKIYFRLVAGFYPHASNCFLVKRWVHEKVGGFDEGIKLGEDFAYIRAAAKVGKFAFISSTFFYVSARRSEENMTKVVVQYLLAWPYMMIFGPVRSNIFRYSFEHPPKNKKKP